MDNIKFEHILAIDPSGNFSEGKGITGYVLIDYEENILEAGTINAKNFERPEEYWEAHLDKISELHYKYPNTIVVIEDYLLYYNRARSQTNSKMETCRLLGVIQSYCWKNKMAYGLQRAVDVKDRWSDSLLMRENILKRMNGRWIQRQNSIDVTTVHVRDAFRHAIHYARCRNNPNKKQYYKPKGVNGNVRSNYENRRWEAETEPRSYRDNRGYRKSPRIW